jgi:hypothetical protein
MHHIFFPPWLQVMAAQQHPDCFASNLRHQLSLDRLLGDQPHGPAGLPSRWIATHHGDHALLFRSIQEFLRAASSTLIEGLLQSALLVSMGDAPNGLRRQVNDPGDYWGSLFRCQLLQGNRPEHDPNLLNPGAQDLPNGLLILAGQLEVDGAS